MIAITNGNIVTMNGDEFACGTVLTEGGKILAVGERADIPSDAQVIDAGGRLVLPGFIDAHSHIGMWEESVGSEGADGNEMSDPVTPHLRGIDGVYPFDPPFAEAVAGGITSVVTGPGSTNVIGGQFLAMKTAGRCADAMVIKDPVAMKCAFGENPKRYYGGRDKAPLTRMGIAAMLRSALRRASDYMQRLEAAGSNVLERPQYDEKHEALIPVLKGELPLKVHAHRSDDILTAIRIAREFGLKITLDHCTEGHLIAEEIAASGFPAIIGPSFGFRSKPELRNKTFETAGILCRAGVKVAIMTDSPVFSQKDLPLFAGMAMHAGMSRSEALASISVNAAEIAGIDDRVGSIAPGKDADIVIWDSDPFAVAAATYMVMVDGRIEHGGA